MSDVDVSEVEEARVALSEIHEQLLEINPTAAEAFERVVIAFVASHHRGNELERIARSLLDIYRAPWWKYPMMSDGLVAGANGGLGLALLWEGWWIQSGFFFALCGYWLWAGIRRRVRLAKDLTDLLDKMTLEMWEEDASPFKEAN